MKARLTTVALLTGALSWTVVAQQSPMRAGSWEVTMKMSMQGMELPPMKHTQCVTQDMLKDPQSAIPRGPEQGSNDCRVTDYELRGSTATYKMTCTKPQPMTMTGEMKYSGTDAYVGNVQMDMSGQKITMALDAKRIGDCGR
jgi:hypothetical protein